MPYANATLSDVYTQQSGEIFIGLGIKSVVKRGDALMLIEAMTMEHAIVAPADGVVATIHFAAGALVEEGIELLTVSETG